MDTYSLGYTSSGFVDMPINHKVFLAQFDAIKKLAHQESCIIVGRCADYALEEYENAISVFIHAKLDSRIKRIQRLYQMTEDKAKDVINKTDKKRASYYNYYSSKKWGDSRSYHLTLDSSHLGLEGCCEMILNYMDVRKKNRKQ